MDSLSYSASKEILPGKVTELYSTGIKHTSRRFDKDNLSYPASKAESPSRVI